VSDATVRPQAVTPAGEVLQGLVEAASRAAVIEKLQADGSVVVRAGELRGRPLGLYPTFSAIWAVRRKCTRAEAGGTPAR
jgi:hypothetical protein